MRNQAANRSLAMLTRKIVARRKVSTTTFLALLGLAAALVPLTIVSLYNGGVIKHDYTYFAVAVIAGGVVGWALRKD